MECSKPGAIRDEELLAYLAGEKVRPFVVQHLAECQHCSSRLAAYRRIDLALTSKLYRWDCLPNQVLGDYHLGLLSKELTAAVKNHLAKCVHCAAEVAALTEFLANDPIIAEWVPAPNMTARAASPHNNHRSGQGVKSALDHLREQSRTNVRRIAAMLLLAPPQFVYQRNLAQTTSWPRRYAAEDLSISIQVEQATSRRDSLQLIGFVTRKGAALETLQGTTVLLSAQNMEASPLSIQYTQSIDELGNFIFSALAPATYTLELQLPESTIVIDQLPVALQD